MKEYETFTSESVSDGHPDKLADRISDAILDAYLRKDENARVACETLINDKYIVIAGEIGSEEIDIQDVDVKSKALEILRKTGYTKDTGMDPCACKVIVALNKQSKEIKQDVDKKGAGDQGMMFGYATDETNVLMPAPIWYAHRLMERHSKVRGQGKRLEFLRPDAKCQLTFLYAKDGQPRGVDTIVFATQHAPNTCRCWIEEGVREEIIKKVIPAQWLTDETKYIFKPFEEGGPVADCGLTGRKVIVDTYGGMARHGGGAFSGKDPSKVDRSAAYALRHVAKNVVAANLASRCEVQVSYVIGQAKPISVALTTFGTGKIPDTDIHARVVNEFDLRPEELIERLRLKRAIYGETAAFGHFGRTPDEEKDNFTWEQTDFVEKLRG